MANGIMAFVGVRCVICCKFYEKAEADGDCFSFLNCSEGSRLLNDQLHVYFITRKLLKLPDKQCIQTIGALSDDNLLRSFSLCPDCMIIVLKGAELHSQIVNLEREIDKLGTSLVQLVRDNSDDDNDLDHHGASGGAVNESFMRIRGCLTSTEGDPSTVKRERDLSDVVIFDDDKIAGEDDFFLSDSTGAFWDEGNDDTENVENDTPKSPTFKVERLRARGSDSDSDYDPETSTPNLKRGTKGRSKYSSIKIDRKGSHFPCEFCKTVYITPHGFRDHLRVHEKSDQLENKYDCTICNHPNLTEERLRLHLTRRHESQKNTCKICGHVALRRWLHEKHMLNKHSITVWTPMTEDANQINSKEGEILEEIRGTDDFSNFENIGDNFQCKMCDSIYTTVPGCKKHIKAHELSSQLGHIFDCTICRHPNTSERNLRRHMTAIHRHKTENSDASSVVIKDEVVGRTALSPVTVLDKQSNLTFNCKRCQSVYTTIPGFRKHMRAHQTSDFMGNIFDCKICGHPTISDRNLSRHYTTTHNKNYQRKPPIVHKADKEFDKQNQNLNDPISCAIIPEIRKEREALPSTSTSASPRGKRLMKCKYCKSVYGTRPGMKKHMRMHRESNQLGNVYDCSVCNHPNTSESKLRRHMTRIHSSEKAVQSPKEIQEDSLPPSPENITTTINSERPKRPSAVNKEMLEASNENGFNEQDRDKDWSPLNKKVSSGSESEESSNEESDSDWDSDSDFESKRKHKSKRNSYNGNNNDELLHCNKCNVSYKSARGFRTHEEEHKRSVGLNHKYDCKKCGFPNSSERRLRYHIRRVHDEIPMFACSICGYRVLRSQQLKRHMQKHNPSYQRRKIGRPSKWLHHVNTEGSFECRICKVSYGGSDSLKKHMLDHKRSDERFDCDICKFPCNSEKRLRTHKNVKHGKPSKPTCEICNKQFLRPNKLKEHMDTHEKYDKLYDPETGDYRCSICPFIGTFRGVIIHKNRFHKGYATNPSDEPHLCSQCGLGFTTAATLRQHVKNKHENRYRFTCEICGKGFEQRPTMEGHMRTHEENRTREFICSICGVSYSHKKTLNEHTNRFHPENSASKRKEKEGSFKCKFCYTIFPFKYLLVNHIPVAHKDLYSFKCDICDKAYISSGSLKLHREITHSDGSAKFSCKYCGKEFQHKHYVICHYKFCHVKRGNVKSGQTTQLPKTGDNKEAPQTSLLPTSTHANSSSVSNPPPPSSLLMMPITTPSSTRFN